MARVLPPLLLLLMPLSPGIAPSATLAMDCNAADTIVKEGQTKVILRVRFHEVKYNLILFVKPDTDFEGVRLDVQETDGTNHTAWLPEECIPRDGTWREFLVWTGLTETKIALRFRTGKCRRWCESETTLRQPIRITVVAHGPSRWIKRYTPENCNVTNVLNVDPERLSICQEPPSISTTTKATNFNNTPSGSLLTSKLIQNKMIIMIIATSVVVAVAVITMVLVLLVCRRRNSVTLSNEAKFQSQVDVLHHYLQLNTGLGQISVKN
ncbi:uncharacterized protein LOC123519663 [Portunus trituberculatus]|nr:uncharacterized protein LOC123519663 [Portunus trituberculatus]